MKQIKKSDDIRIVIGEIIGKSKDILEDAEFVENGEEIREFEDLISSFEKLDKRKDEDEDDTLRFKRKRDNERNKFISLLMSKMRDRIDFFEKELEIAHRIQKKMIPKELPSVEGYELEGFYRPSKQVGGDYYDCFFNGDDHMYFVIADVSGKGIPSSLVVASMQAYIHAEIQENQPLNVILENLNNYLVDTLEYEKFVTLFMGKLEFADGKISYINAGHNPPFVINTDRLVELKGGGPILGQFKDILYEIHDSVMKKGDVLAMFTDGVTEEFNEKEEEFSEERFVNSIKKNTNKPLMEVFVDLIKEIKKFTGNKPFGDDLTMLFIRKKDKQ
ncbi:MAG: PP2C family protein-serine/threonine phosphatase [bacterium]|nr:PP2C family protein-serine/threonine phosphatase [bacterium]